MIFVDASVLLAAEDLDDENHRAATALLESDALATIELAAYEVTNVAVLRWKDPDAARRLAERVWAIAEFGSLVRIDRELTDQVADLARRYELSAYDAGYVAGASRLGAPLASCDQRDLVSRGFARLPHDFL